MNWEKIKAALALMPFVVDLVKMVTGKDLSEEVVKPTGDLLIEAGEAAHKLGDFLTTAGTGLNDGSLTGAELDASIAAFGSFLDSLKDIRLKTGTADAGLVELPGAQALPGTDGAGSFPREVDPAPR